MENDDAKEPVKKPYHAPEISRVPLRAEEAVLGGCKTAGVGGPVASDCTGTSND
jgi:hypothetical protein